MSARLAPFHRLGVLIYTYFAYILLSIILFPLSAAWFIIDGILQIVTGNQGLVPGGSLATWLMGVQKWTLHNTQYALFGKGSFRWTASM